MSVKNLRIIGAWLGLVTAVACGPEETATESTWMLGVWSGAQPGDMIESCGVPRLEIREDGALIDGSMEGTCLSNPEPGESFEYTWEQHRDDEIEAHRVTDPASGFRITRGEDCNQIVATRFQGDVEISMRTYYRGKVCAIYASCPPDVGNCHEIGTRWCDGEEAPPACEDAAMP